MNRSSVGFTIGMVPLAEDLDDVLFMESELPQQKSGRAGNLKNIAVFCLVWISMAEDPGGRLH